MLRSARHMSLCFVTWRVSQCSSCFLSDRGVSVSSCCCCCCCLSVHPAACLELRTVTVSPCGPCEQSVTMTDVMINSCKASAEEMGLKHDDNRLPFQIFPDPCDSYEGQCKLKDRLPSIVVEPTDVSEVESGELRWPPEEFLMAEQGGEGEGLVPQAGELAQIDTEPVSQEMKTQKNVEPGQSLSSNTQLFSSTLIQPGQTFTK
ncbi:uncharacterized protein LOC122544465 [Chiloscyllium plagiosum]|uniref:uncharacterized protein LOC122544465 n=1 Tax=Chiloscyllium plagiosum TaxID=36176 RepID=UPI001CB85776|nr:uncharacterized protein LOC122544465 [Chiloscyllium plagiosum]